MEGEKLELLDRAAAVEAIWRMSEDDLRFLNRLIVDRLKLISQARHTVMLAQFRVGDRVSFQSPSGDCKVGIVVRLNKKTASIATDDGQHWNVHPSFLTAVGGAEGVPRGAIPG